MDVQLDGFSPLEVRGLATMLAHRAQGLQKMQEIAEQLGPLEKAIEDEMGDRLPPGTSAKDVRVRMGGVWVVGLPDQNAQVKEEAEDGAEVVP